MDDALYNELVEVCEAYVRSRVRYLAAERAYEEATRDYTAATNTLVEHGRVMARDTPAGVSANTFYPIDEQEQAMAEACARLGIDYKRHEALAIFREGFTQHRLRERITAAPYN